MTTTPIADLMALALLRRMLLEMGHELNPEAMGAEAHKVGSLELWLHTKQDALAGRTPVLVLQGPGGQDLVRPLLAALVQASAAARAEPGTRAGEGVGGRPASEG